MTKGRKTASPLRWIWDASRRRRVAVWACSRYSRAGCVLVCTRRLRPRVESSGNWPANSSRALCRLATRPLSLFFFLPSLSVWKIRSFHLSNPNEVVRQLIRTFGAGVLTAGWFVSFAHSCDLLIFLNSRLIDSRWSSFERDRRWWKRKLQNPLEAQWTRASYGRS